MKRSLSLVLEYTIMKLILAVSFAVACSIALAVFLIFSAVSERLYPIVPASAMTAPDVCTGCTPSVADLIRYAQETKVPLPDAATLPK